MTAKRREDFCQREKCVLTNRPVLKPHSTVFLAKFFAMLCQRRLADYLRICGGGASSPDKKFAQKSVESRFQDRSNMPGRLFSPNI